MKTSIPIITNVFVYGTLKRGQCREKMWPRAPLSIRPGFVRGWLFDLGPYPGMWCADCLESDCKQCDCDSHDQDERQCDWVEGEIWSLAKQDMAATIEELDEIEETNQPQVANQYDQILVRVYDSPSVSNGQSTSQLALTYQFSRLNDLIRAKRIRAVSSDGCVAWPIAHR
jgi:gamma-glutamylcyclotransferase (GGCT)/AIG2-like uncharacterized protein YtfP